MERSDAKRYSYEGSSSSSRYSRDEKPSEEYYKRREHRDYRDRCSRDRRDSEQDRRDYRESSSSRDRHGYRHPKVEKFERDSSRERYSSSPNLNRGRSPSHERYARHNYGRDTRERSPARSHAHDRSTRSSSTHRHYDLHRVKHEVDERKSPIPVVKRHSTSSDRSAEHVDWPMKQEVANDKYDKYDKTTTYSGKNDPWIDSAPQPSTSGSNIFKRLGPKAVRVFNDCNVKVLPKTPLTHEEIDDIINENNDLAGQPDGLNDLKILRREVTEIKVLRETIKRQEDERIAKEMAQELALERLKRLEPKLPLQSSPGAAHVEPLANNGPPSGERLANKYNPKPRQRDPASPNVNQAFPSEVLSPSPNMRPLPPNQMHPNPNQQCNNNLPNVARPIMQTTYQHTPNRDPRMSIQPEPTSIFANMNPDPFPYNNVDTQPFMTHMNTQLPSNIPPNVRGVFGGGGFSKPNEPPMFGPRIEPNVNPFGNPGPYGNVGIPTGQFNNIQIPTNNFSASNFNNLNNDNRRFNSPANDSAERQRFESARRERENCNQTYREHRLAKEREARERAAAEQAKQSKQLADNANDTNVTNRNGQMQDEACTSSSSPNNLDTNIGSSSVDKAFRTNNWKELPSASATNFKIPKLKPTQSNATANHEQTVTNKPSNTNTQKSSVRVREADTASAIEDNNSAISNSSDVNSRQAPEAASSLSRDPRRRPRSHTITVEQNDKVENKKPQDEQRDEDELLKGDAFIKTVLKQCEDPKFFNLIAPSFDEKTLNAIKKYLNNKNLHIDDGDVSSSTSTADTGAIDDDGDDIDDSSTNNDGDSVDSMADSSIENTKRSNAKTKSTTRAKANAKRAPRKQSNELSRLQEDLRSMFMTDNGSLNLNGRRLCTLANENKTKNAAANAKDKAKGAAANELPKNDESAAPKRVIRRRNTTVMSRPPVTADTDEDDADAASKTAKPAAPKRVAQRRNTLASRPDEATTFDDDEVAPARGAAKKIGSRRMTRCELIDTPSDDSDRPAPIRLKITSVTSDSTKTQKKQQTRKRQIVESESQEESVQEDDGNDDIQPTRGSRQTVAKKRSHAKETSPKGKKAKKPAVEVPSRPRLSRECKVILNKLDTATMDLSGSSSNITTATTTAKKKKQKPDDSSHADNDVHVELDDDRVEETEDEVASGAPKAKRAKTQAEKYKNVNKFSYYGNPDYEYQCVLCPYKNKNRIESHFVNIHKDYEYFLARPSPEMANALRVSRTVVTALPKKHFKAFCYFCQEDLSFYKESWIQHVARHTCEFTRKCLSCKHIYMKSRTPHKCSKPHPYELNNFNFDNHLIGYMCKFCNFTQLREEAVQNHLKVQHRVTSTNEVHYDNVYFLYNFYGLSESELQSGKLKNAKEKETEKETEKELTDPPVFKATEPGESDLFDQDTMNLIKQNISCRGEEEPKKAGNRGSMIDLLSQRFGAAQRPNMDENVENVDDSLQDDLVDLPRAGPSSNATSPSVHSTTAFGSTHASVADDDLAKTEDDLLDFENDDDWEDCSSGSDIEEAEKVSAAPKNVSIQQTLHRLLGRTKKTKTTTTVDKIKSTKKDEVTPATVPTDIEKPSVQNLITNNSSSTLTITSVMGNVKMPPINEPTDEIETIIVENLSAKKQKDQYEFRCDFCSWDVAELSELFDHISEKHDDELWSGRCATCMSTVAAHPMSLDFELRHLNQVHCRKRSEEPVAQTSTPTIKVRRLSGDMLSVNENVPASQIPKPIKIESIETKGNLLVGNAILKPWIQRNVSLTKRADDAEKMLRRVSLCADFKCMGRMCIFTTNDPAKMRQHLKNHDQDAETRLSTDASADRDSWLECAYCDVTCTVSEVLIMHVQQQHSNSIYQCHKCFYRASARIDIYFHSKKYHIGEDPLIIHLDKQVATGVNEKLELFQHRVKYLKSFKCPSFG